MGLVERTLCLGAVRITSNLACSKGSIFTQTVSGQTIILLLFTDICVTGYLFICWFADLELANSQEVISLRFAAFLNETYNAVTFLIPALIAVETHFTTRRQRMSASGKCQIFAQPVPVSHPLPLVNGIYALFCWTIAASYGVRYYPDDIRFAHQCSGVHPFDRLHCLRGFHLPDPCLTLVELLVVTSYVFYQSMCMGSSEVQCQISIMKLIAPSGSPLSEDVSDLPLNSSHPRTTQSTCTPATQPGSLLTGLVATLMLYPGLPYLGLTSSLISCFEQLCCSFFARLSKCSKHGVEPTQSDSQRFIHMLLNISERKGCKLLGNTGRQDEEIALSISCNGN